MHKLVILLGISLIISCRSTNQKQEQATSKADSIAQSTDWAMFNFVKIDSLNPILLPSTDRAFVCPILKKSVKWEEKDVFNPSAVVRAGKVYLIYRAEDTIGKFAGTSRIGLAVSNNGLHFQKMDKPVFFPDNDSMKKYEWEGGCEDPRIVESEDGTYVMTYTAYDGKIARLLLATSKDLTTWQKHGLVLGEGKHKDTWSKSGAIVCKQVGERMVATKINGKYWMYWGDTDLMMATSDDLIHWQAAENEQGTLVKVLSPRKGYFDSQLVESGPYALLTDKGILLIYNAANSGESGDKSLPKMTYAAGQALFSATDPMKLVARLEQNFFRPDKPYERTGQVNNVCFLEGLVSFKGRWFLYYGTADSKIAVAVRE